MLSFGVASAQFTWEECGGGDWSERVTLAGSPHVARWPGREGGAELEVADKEKTRTTRSCASPEGKFISDDKEGELGCDTRKEALMRWIG